VTRPSAGPSGQPDYARLAPRHTQLQQQLQEALAVQAQQRKAQAQLQHQLAETVAQQRQHASENTHLQKQLLQERATSQKLRKQIEELKNIEKRLFEQRLEKPGT
jgi:hypothetical protein